MYKEYEDYNEYLKANINLENCPLIMKVLALKDGFANNGEMFCLKDKTYVLWIYIPPVEGYSNFVFDELGYPYGHPMTDGFLNEYFKKLPH